MKNLKNLIFAALICVSPLSAQAGSGVGSIAGTGGASEMTQLMNNAELISIYAGEMQQLQQQIQMYTNMYQNTVGLPLQAWSSVESQLRGIIQLVNSTKNVVNMSDNAMSQIEQQFGNGNLLDNYQNRMTDWNRGLTSQIGTVLTQYGQQANRFTTTQSALEQIQNASQSATGRMQVMQAGNQIAGMMVNQLMDLQTTIMSAESARLNHIAIQEARLQQDRLRQERFVGKAQVRY